MTISEATEFFSYTFNQDWNGTLDACQVFVISSDEGKFIS